MRSTTDMPAVSLCICAGCKLRVLYGFGVFCRPSVTLAVSVKSVRAAFSNTPDTASALPLCMLVDLPERLRPGHNSDALRALLYSFLICNGDRRLRTAHPHHTGQIPGPQQNIQ